MAWGASRRRRLSQSLHENSDVSQLRSEETAKPQRKAQIIGRFVHSILFRLRRRTGPVSLEVKIAVLIFFFLISRIRITWRIISPTEHDSLASSHYPRTVRHIVDGGKVWVERLKLEQEHNLKERRDDDLRGRTFTTEYNFIRPFETKDCRAQYEWQLNSYPTCNIIHESDLNHNRTFFVTNGYWRDVWRVMGEGMGNDHILKTLRYQHEFSPGNYDRHRRDAMAMQRLTKSNYVLDIYAYCANSGLFEYGSGGDIMNAIWPRHNTTERLTKRQKLHIATQAAMGVAAVHNVDKEGQASIAHTDISPGQFICTNGIYKLNDFNRARFIRWSRSDDKPCGYRVGKNPGTNRSPEEYQYLEQTEKVDIYSLGNIFYMLLQEEWPFEDLDEAKAKELVINGTRPSFYDEVWNSEHPIDKALKEAMIMCHQQNPKDRATAREVERFLKEKLSTLDPVAIQKWEKSLSANN